MNLRGPTDDLAVPVASAQISGGQMSRLTTRECSKRTPQRFGWSRGVIFTTMALLCLLLLGLPPTTMKLAAASVIGGSDHAREATVPPSGTNPTRATLLPRITDLSFATPTPVLPDATGSGQLFGLSCPSATTCVAVGYDGVNAIYSTGTLSSGTWTWTQSTAVAPVSPGGGEFFGVSCPSATFCVAVGTDMNGGAIFATGAESGSTWTWSPSVLIPPDSYGRGFLNSVDCVSTTSCIAVGGNYNSGGISAIGTESGGTWSWVSSAVAPDNSDNGYLTGVSCPTPTACIAVGTNEIVEGTFATSSWSWSSIDAGVFGLSADDFFRGVSCADLTDCVAVGGNSITPPIYATGTFAGSAWAWSINSIVPVSTDSLYSVDCGGATWCVAVGTAGASLIYSSGNDSGGSWSWSPDFSVSPDESAGAGEFYGVVCTSQLSCVAAGQGGPQGVVDASLSSATAPITPIDVGATAGVESATVDWTAQSDGGSTITGYTVTADDTTSSITVSDACPTSDSSTLTSCTVNGLTDGDDYEFAVAAINAVGTGPLSFYTQRVIPSASSSGGGSGGGSGGSGGGSGGGLSGGLGGGSSGSGGTPPTSSTLPSSASSPPPPSTSILTASPVPTPREVTYFANSVSLSANARTVLGALGKKLEKGARVTVVGYAHHDAALAKKRAMIVAQFLENRVAIHVTLKLSTASFLAKVLVTTTKM
ncbi:MAG: fibronectin type III domain-containing protein [Acidimicrobiales bacterium]